MTFMAAMVAGLREVFNNIYINKIYGISRTFSAAAGNPGLVSIGLTRTLSWSSEATRAFSRVQDRQICGGASDRDAGIPHFGRNRRRRCGERRWPRSAEA